MTPTSSFFYVANSTGGYSILCGRLSKRPSIFYIFSNVQNCFLYQNAIAVIRPLPGLGMSLRPMPTLSRAILHVVELISKKQMFRINTGPVITFMKNAKTIWDRAIMKLVRKPMCAIPSPTVVDPAVSSSILTAGPNPTTTSFFQVLKKPNFNIYFSGHNALYNKGDAQCQLHI